VSRMAYPDAARVAFGETASAAMCGWLLVFGVTATEYDLTLSLLICLASLLPRIVSTASSLGTVSQVEVEGRRGWTRVLPPSLLEAVAVT
jgi:hypothetical protein